MRTKVIFWRSAGYNLIGEYNLTHITLTEIPLYMYSPLGHFKTAREFQNVFAIHAAAAVEQLADRRLLKSRGAVSTYLLV